MKNTNLLLKMGYKFSVKYLNQYFTLLFKPALVAVVGIFFLLMVNVNPVFGFLAIFITIPCICYAFWQGYIITFTLNYAAIDFLEEGTSRSLDELLVLTKKREKELIKYVGYCALMTILGTLPTIFYACSKISITELLYNPMGQASSLIGVFIAFIINSVFLVPFLNFCNQAFLFKKEKESFFNLFLNCYKKLNSTGIIIALLFSLLGCLLGSLNPIVYVIGALILNLFSSSINTFWYYSRKNI